MKILLTGATGYVSHLLIEDLARHHDLVLVDVKDTSRYRQIEGVHVVDLSDPDIERYAALFDGVDVVVHNAFNRTEGHVTMAPRQWLADQPPGVVDGYFAERVNLDMAFNVYKAAVAHGVRRVVHSSSNHSADWYESLLHSGRMDIVSPHDLPLSNGYYGWAKATIEHLGFIFASGRFGRPIESINIRIGSPRPVSAERFRDHPVSLRRELGAFISDRDLRQLYRKSIETPDIANAHGIPFQIFYGISNNTRAFWSIENARRVIDYRPEDDSEQLYRDEIATHLTAGGRTFG